MGLRFDMGSANVVAYLTAPAGVKPRLRICELDTFLRRLGDDSDLARPRLISSNMDWAHDLQATARRIRQRLCAEITDTHSEDVIDPEKAAKLLEPLARVLGRYDLYILPVGTWRHQEVLDGFAREAANLPGHGILVLIPDYYDGEQNVRVLDPSVGTSSAIKNRDLWPGAIFMLRTGEANFLPLEDAYPRLAQLADIMAGHDVSGTRQRGLRELVSLPSARVEASQSIRILHLSDLHMGTRRAAKAQSFLLANLKKRFGSVDQIVITGDLFDQPFKRHAQAFENFSDDLRLLSDKDPIVVPGNHDQRIYGNSWWRIGRRLRQLVDLEWRRLVIADDKKVAFLCFDSSRTEDLARGRVDADQLLSMAKEFDVTNSAGRLEGFLRIALVHHHPYPYGGSKEAPIIDPRSWVGRENFIQMRDAPRFLSWCAGRDVTLILHGHKHRPRLVNDRISLDGNGDHRTMATVGCGSSLGANNGPFSFNLLEWRPDTQSWSVDFQISRGDGQGFASAAVEQVSLAGAG